MNSKMKMINAIDFIVNINDLHETQLISKSLPEELHSNQVILEIEKFSLTSNNITYGVVGEQMNYWSFFPTKQGYGIIPAWGFARVIVSNHAEVKVVQRFYGYYPMSTHLVVTANRTSKNGFIDNTMHRQGLPAVYNYYSITSQDPTSTPEKEALTSIFRPLFITSFLIDAELEDKNSYDASCIILTSASSKTAQALAFLIAQRKKENRLNFELVGLTSSNNLKFVKQLGSYDKAIDYSEVSKLNKDVKSIIVDFTGNHNLQFKLQTQLMNNLVYNCLVGLVDWKNLKGEKALPRKGDFFFAPTHASKRQKEWGASVFQQKVSNAWQEFSVATLSTIAIQEYNGPENLKHLYLDMLDGKIDPKKGNIISLN